MHYDIEVVYIATNGYNRYAHGFIDSLKYLAPSKTKHLTIISDELNIFDIKTDIDFKIVKILDGIYPTINTNKPYYINQVIEDIDAKYVFYFDADTIIHENNLYNWDKIFNEMDNGKMLISQHPWYMLKNEEDIIPHDEYLMGRATEHENEWSTAYMPNEKYTYVISSFFAARKDIMIAVNEEVRQMEMSDLCWEHKYYIPQQPDENYYNRLVFDYTNRGIENYKFYVSNFNVLNGFENKENEDVFMTQKFLGDYKTYRK